ncbi:hypothetical protein TorRG33x02_288410 [Trema orientale]|uniref:Uncharacterized protein n=1 Tax=Trema orientale TaxID=63057 RepID=A0A2P5CEB9_TREOI|nr:hypothetical protein TorRG33x02_288410 [Trema orientale]
MSTKQCHNCRYIRFEGYWGSQACSSRSKWRLYSLQHSLAYITHYIYRHDHVTLHSQSYLRWLQIRVALLAGKRQKWLAIYGFKASLDRAALAAALILSSLIGLWWFS